MCEAAAQLSSCYCKAVGLLETGFVGFGGMEDVRFRGPVRPGDRLVLVGKAIRLHRRHSIFDVQGFVGTNMVFHGKVLGVTMTSRKRARDDCAEESSGDRSPAGSIELRRAAQESR